MMQAVEEFTKDARQRLSSAQSQSGGAGRIQNNPTEAMMMQTSTDLNQTQTSFASELFSKSIRQNVLANQFLENNWGEYRMQNYQKSLRQPKSAQRQNLLKIDRRAEAKQREVTRLHDQMIEIKRNNKKQELHQTQNQIRGDSNNNLLGQNNSS